MSAEDLSDLARRLTIALRLEAAPIAIAFRASDAPPFGAASPPPNEAGRTGAVPAGCVFWMKATHRTFSTSPSDHANCSVGSYTLGSYTHGLINLATAATRDDVAAVLAAGWVDEAAVTGLPHVRARPESITYGPLAACTTLPDVVLVRLDGLGLMGLHGAIRDLRVEGRPQCHIVALAKEEGAVAASVGCALSRARTGMPPQQMTCAIPGSRLREVVERLESIVALDRTMANYGASGTSAFTASTPTAARSALRASITTDAPCAERARALSSPSPPAAPVMTMRRPVKSRPSRISSVVVSRP
jgi:uncharacterized protein (DUF169 family)